MNGDFKELLGSLEKLMVTRDEALTKSLEEKHQENKDRFKDIFSRLNSLPCDKRSGFYTYIKWHLTILTTAVFSIIGWIAYTNFIVR